MILFNKRSLFVLPLLPKLFYSFSNPTNIPKDNNFNLILQRLKLNVKKSQ